MTALKHLTGFISKRAIEFDIRGTEEIADEFAREWKYLDDKGNAENHAKDHDGKGIALASLSPRDSLGKGHSRTMRHPPRPAGDEKDEGGGS